MTDLPIPPVPNQHQQPELPPMFNPLPVQTQPPTPPTPPLRSPLAGPPVQSDFQRSIEAASAAYAGVKPASEDVAAEGPAQLHLVDAKLQEMGKDEKRGMGIIVNWKFLSPEENKGRDHTDFFKINDGPDANVRGIAGWKELLKKASLPADTALDQLDTQIFPNLRGMVFAGAIKNNAGKAGKIWSNFNITQCQGQMQ